MQEPQVSAVTAALKADALGDHGTLQRPLQVRVFSSATAQSVIGGPDSCIWRVPRAVTVSPTSVGGRSLAQLIARYASKQLWHGYIYSNRAVRRALL